MGDQQGGFLAGLGGVGGGERAERWVEPASSGRAGHLPQCLSPAGLRDVWSPLWHAVYTKPGRGHCGILPLPLSRPQWLGPVSDGTAAPGPW